MLRPAFRVLQLLLLLHRVAPRKEWNLQQNKPNRRGSVSAHFKRAHSSRSVPQFSVPLSVHCLSVSTYVCIYLCIYLSVCLSPFSLSTSVCIYPSLYLFVCLSIYLFIYLFSFVCLYSCQTVKQLILQKKRHVSHFTFFSVNFRQRFRKLIMNCQSPYFVDDHIL